MHHLQHIAEIAEILKHERVHHVVICPGSRNAPLIQVFTRDSFFSCHSIVDERSAAYVALGMARELNEPVIIVTTSGTATLNLAPAIAEAFYQRIPLIVLTADRPHEWPPQFNNQIVTQIGVYDNNCKSSYTLPSEIDSEELLLSEMENIYTLLKGVSGSVNGPVHLNIPLNEPLYVEIPTAALYSIPEVDISGLSGLKNELNEREQEVFSIFNSEKKVLLIAGISNYSSAEKEILQKLTNRFQLVTIAENLSNLDIDKAISNPELLLGSLREEDLPGYTPDLVIAFCGQVVSKRTKIFVQNMLDVPIFTFENFPSMLFEEIYKEYYGSDKNYFQEIWKKVEALALEKTEAYFKNTAFSNLLVMKNILECIPGGAVLHLGNSGSVRYSQLFPVNHELKYFSNRGTSGIDGSLSTAVGAALVSEETHVALLGDLSFVYDSNALWNRSLPKNLKIIVLDDAGGGIFKIIKGPEQMPFFKDFSVANHPVDIVQLAIGYGVKAISVTDNESLRDGLEVLFSQDSDLQLMHIDTSQSENSSIFKNLFETLKKK